MYLSLEEKRQRRNTYMRGWYARYKEQHGVSKGVQWRRENPTAAKLHREREKARWYREPEVRRKHREKGGEWRLALKIEVMDAYGGPICACCGEQILAFLSLDHTDNDGAAHRRTLKQLAGATNFYQYLKTQGFPKTPRLQVFCFNCNYGKRINGGVCPHQTKEG